MKAQNLLGNDLVEVTQYTKKIYDQGDMQKLVALIDGDSEKANREDVVALAALMIGKCRMNASANGPVSPHDFQIYVRGLQEVFSAFPYSVGLLAIDAGTGVPGKTPFWPKPYDLVEACQKMMDQRRIAKVNALRYIAESKRRAENREDEKEESDEEWAARKARVAKVMQGFHSGMQKKHQMPL